jgi:hypothetical protein
MSTPLPAWIDREAWSGFVEFRKRQERLSRGKIAWTARAEMLVLKEAYKLHDLGHDVNASLDQSVTCGWTSLFEPKDKAFTNVKPRECMTSLGPDMTEAERVAADERRREVMSKFKPRRVA